MCEDTSFEEVKAAVKKMNINKAGGLGLGMEGWHEPLT